MRVSNSVVWLTLLIIVLAVVASGVGLFYQDGGSSFSFKTLRGDATQIYGQGLYRYDSPIIALGNRSGDAVNLVLGIPILIASVLLYRRGSLKGRLILSGTLAYFLYYYGSTAFGTAYNNLFVLYVVLLSASFYGFVLSLTAFDLNALPSYFTNRLPRRGIGIYLIVSGIVLMFVWLLLSIVPALAEGKAPAEIANYTTVITIVVDEGFIVPTLILAGVLLLRRAPLGYLLASTLLVFTVMLGINLTVAGIVQLAAGVVTVGQFMGFTTGFSILTLFAIWFTLVLFRNFSDTAVAKRTAIRTATA